MFHAYVPTPAELAAVDQEIARVSEGLDELINLAITEMARQDGGAAVATAVLTTGLRRSGCPVSAAALVAVAVVRLAQHRKDTS